jgi:hypothetical protein
MKFGMVIITNILKRYLWNIVFKLTMTNKATVQTFTVISNKLNRHNFYISNKFFTEIK